MKIEYISPVLFITNIETGSFLSKSAQYKKLLSSTKIAGRLKYAIQYVGKRDWYVLKEFLRLLFFGRITIKKGVINIECPKKFLAYKGSR